MVEGMLRNVSVFSVAERNDSPYQRGILVFQPGSTFCIRRRCAGAIIRLTGTPGRLLMSHGAPHPPCRPPPVPHQARHVYVGGGAGGGDLVGLHNSSPDPAVAAVDEQFAVLIDRDGAARRDRLVLRPVDRRGTSVADVLTARSSS